MTVRRDIAALEQQGRVYSVPSGVKLAERLHSEPSFLDKSVTDLDNKRAMAAAAAELITPGQTIYLDAGTTLGQIVPLIWDVQDLTVVTNDITTAGLLVDHPSVELYHVGGRIDRENRSSIGDLAAASVAEFNLDTAFISTSSWDLGRGSTTPSEMKVTVKRAAMRAASLSVLVASSAKYGTFGTFRVSSLQSFDQIISDAGLPESTLYAIREKGIDIRAVRTSAQSSSQPLST
nr:DeoR/GlpR family DNA-binding transcription regulator [Nesterenkonia muleiensis]